jgi:hypothetical protein
VYHRKIKTQYSVGEPIRRQEAKGQPELTQSLELRQGQRTAHKLWEKSPSHSFNHTFSRALTGDWACEQEPPDFLEAFLFFLSASHKIDFPNFYLGNKPDPKTKSLRGFWFLVPHVVLFYFFCGGMVLEFNSTFCVFRGRECFRN